VASPSTGFTSTTSQATLINPSAGTYNFTVTIQNNNGTGTCTATATSSLSVSTAPIGCTMSATVTQSACNNNGTPTTIPKSIADDYFNITVTATNGSSTGTFEVVLNNTVLGNGTYNTNIVVSGANGVFKANGATTYTLIIRDQTINSCNTTKITTAVTSCSNNCPTQLCPIITLQKLP
jgi:trimeric autotransporter adhesin